VAGKPPAQVTGWQSGRKVAGLAIQVAGLAAGTSDPQVALLILRRA
jgi:hypothetical protein